MDFNAGNNAFWKGKQVLVTGHTGFKGAWATLMLTRMGAIVSGVSLPPNTQPNLFELTSIAERAKSYICDLRDLAATEKMIAEVNPEIVFHMAAQPLVRLSYTNPVDTFTANVIGTVNLLDALRRAPQLKAVLVVTSDKVYENLELGLPFTEVDRLGGHDPYAASKAATEIIVASYRRSFFEECDVRIVTARGGNVIGGGDFSEDRLIPDVWRAIRSKSPLKLRNPSAKRPWQHVLDCLSGYFSYAQHIFERADLPVALNFGPDNKSTPMSVMDLAQAMLASSNGSNTWEKDTDQGPHEMNTLSIDSKLARETLGWKDLLAGHKSIEWTAAWYGALDRKEDMTEVTLGQIVEYESLRTPQ